MSPSRVPRGRVRGTLGSALAGAYVATVPADAQLTVRLTGVPEGTPAGTPIYVAGSFNGWNPSSPVYRMMPRGGEYVLTLDREIRGYVEFKFTRGSWETAEGDAAGKDVANRAFMVPDTGAATYTGAVASWVDPGTRSRPAPSVTKSVTVLDTAFAIPQLGRTRRVWLYLPPDYATTTKRYPVLYMHDGQNLFDDATAFSGEWGVDEALDSLHARGDHGAIVVAVDNGGQKRLDEYSPWRNERFGGGDGAAYVEFLARTLKPYVDARYRTRPGREHTGIMGSSMGGLISLYAGLRHPEVFGRVGVFSPSLWFSPLVWPEARAAKALGSRFYFLSGGLEGPESNPGIVVADQRRMVDTLAAAGLSRGPHLRGEERADGRHSEWFWKREFADAYRWLFGE